MHCLVRVQIGSKLRLGRMSGNFHSCLMTLVLSFILEFLTLRQFEGVGFHLMRGPESSGLAGAFTAEPFYWPLKN